MALSLLMRGLFALLCVLLLAAGASAAKHWDEPASAPGFQGELIGKVKWVHNSGFYFVLIPERIEPVGGNAGAYRDIVGKDVKVAIGRWVGAGEPASDLGSFVATLQPGQTLTIKVQGEDDYTFRFREAPGGSVGAAPAESAKPAASAKPATTKSPFIRPENPKVQPALQTVDESVVTGARIDESAIETILHVNAAADAGGNGGETNPFATLTEALDGAAVLLKQGKSVRVLLHPGLYEEGDIELSFPDDKVARRTTLVIEGDTTGGGEVIFSGSDRFTGWTDEGGGLWSHDWPYDFGFHAGLMGRHNVLGLLGQRREMMFVDGRWMHPVILEDHDYAFKPGEAKIKEGQHGQNKGDLKDVRGYWTYNGFRKPHKALFPGSFGIAEREDNGNRIYLRLEPGDDPNTMDVRVTTRKQFARIGYKDNLVLRNVVIEHFGPFFFAGGDGEGWRRQAGAIQFGLPGAKDLFQLHDLRVENVELRWNSSGGFRFQGIQGLTVRGLRSHYNGQGGGGLGTVHNMVWEDVSTNFNNWRGVLGEKLGWAIAGTKFHEFRDAVIRRHTAIGNLTQGIWMDVNCENFVIDEPVSVANTSGVFLEISKGPMAVRRGVFAHNGRSNIKLLCAEHVTLENNILYSPDGAPGSGLVFDEDIYKKHKDVTCGISFQHYNRASYKGNAQWDVFGTELYGRPKTHNDFWLPGPVRAMGNVISVGDYAYAIFASLWFTPDVRAPELFEGAWQGVNNTYHLTNTAGFLFVDFDEPEESPNRFTDYGLFEWDARFGEQDASFINPRLMDPENYDFRLSSESPLANRVDELPSVKLDDQTIMALNEWRRFVADLRPHTRDEAGANE